ncbi:MAG: hypothetical protein K2X66_14830 [Cyanobacteria bacterium]|nr:hypothetical protein [Cyanobacteriota bacterium]
MIHSFNLSMPYSGASVLRRPAGSSTPHPFPVDVKDTVSFKTAPKISGISSLRFGEAPPTLLKDAVFTVMDMEMTGINGIDNNDIIQIAAKKYKNGKIIGSYTTLVKPNQPISAFIQNLTKITQAAADKAPPLKTALKGLVDFVGEKPLLVGHYIGLDIGFLRRKLPQVGLGEFQDRFQLEKSICTWTLAEKVMPGLNSYRVETIGPALGIIKNTHHDAESDVETAFDMMNKLIDKAKNMGIEINTVQEVMETQGSPVGNIWITHPNHSQNN